MDIFSIREERAGQENLLDLAPLDGRAGTGPGGGSGDGSADRGDAGGEGVSNCERMRWIRGG